MLRQYIPFPLEKINALPGIVCIFEEPLLHMTKIDPGSVGNLTDMLLLTSFHSDVMKCPLSESGFRFIAPSDYNISC